MPAAGRFQDLRRPPERHVVGFRAAAGEDDFGRLGADEVRDRGPRFVEQRLGLLPEVMNARGIAEIFLEGTRDDLDHRRIGWRRCVMVEIGARHGSSGESV